MHEFPIYELCIRKEDEMKRILRKKNIETFIIIMLPLVSVYIGLLSKGFGFRDIIPYWSDEANYYHIIESMLDYGIPIGYNGYNGSSALIGTFGFHGIVILLPYFLFAKVFGLYPYTIAMANVMFVIASLIIYKMLVKPNNRKFLVVSLIASFSPMIMVFLTTNMLEGINVFFAITLAAFFIRLIKNPTNKIYVVSFILIVFATLSKVTWGVFIFPWLLLFLKGNSVKKVVVCSVLTISFIALNYLLFFFVSAPYFSSQVATLVAMLKRDGLWHGGFEIIWIFLNNLSAPFKIGLKSGNLFFILTSISFIMVIVFQIVLCIRFVIRRDQKKKLLNNNNKLILISLWLFFSTYFGVSLLYSATIVALRTLYPILVCSLLLYIYASKIPRIHMVVAIGTLTSFVVILTNDIYYEHREFSSKEYQIQLTNQRDYMQENMKIDAKANRWDNTIAVFLNVPFSYWEAAPSGVGYNLYSDIPADLNDIKAKYVLAMNGDNRIMDAFLNGGYFVQSTDGITSILVKK